MAETLYKTYARVKIDAKNPKYALTLMAQKRMCDTDVTYPPRYDEHIPLTAIALTDGWRWIVLNDGYELVGPVE
jgi:hypothetical protein